MLMSNADFEGRLKLIYSPQKINQGRTDVRTIMNDLKVRLEQM
jgi:hypothetical protein